MPYGTIKVDNVIYTKGGVDTTITVSGIVDSLSGAISVTGAISGASVSATTGTFTTLSGNTTAGTTATFTSGIFTTFSGTTVNVVSGVFASGTVALPSVSVGTSGNGLYSPGTNQVGISTSGNGRLTVDSAGNVSVDGSTVYIDAANNRVGLGTASPTSLLHLVTSSSSGSSNTDGIRINSGGNVAINIGSNSTTGYGWIQSANWGAGYISTTINPNGGNVGIGTTSPVATLHSRTDNAGSGSTPLLIQNRSVSANTAVGISFAPNTSDTADRSAVIYGVNSSGGTGNATDLAFHTNANGGSPTEKMRLDASGNLGIKNSSPTSYNAAADDLVVGLSGDTGMTIVSGTANQGSIFFADGTTGGAQQAAGYLYYLHSNDSMGFGTANTLWMTLDASGNLGLGTTALNSYSNTTTFTIGNSVNSARIDFKSGSTTTAYVSSDSNSGLYFGTNGSERATIDSSGRLLVGTSSARSNFVAANVNSAFQIEGAGGDYTNQYRSLSLTFNINNTQGPNIFLAKTRSASNGGVTVVNSGDEVGTIYFCGADGTNLPAAASIGGFVDGAPGADDMPGRLVFSTTADGAASPTERLRIQENGDLRIANATVFYPATDNAVAIGANVLRFSVVYAVNGTIQTSDEREKTAVTDSSLGTSFIKSLRPVSYKWIEGGKRATGERDDDNNYIYESVPGERTHWGFIAQEVKQAVDAAGVDFGGWVLTDKDDPDSQQALRYDQFIAPLTKALQEALEKIETLEAKVAALESR